LNPTFTKRKYQPQDRSAAITNRVDLSLSTIVPLQGHAT